MEQNQVTYIAQLITDSCYMILGRYAKIVNTKFNKMDFKELNSEQYKNLASFLRVEIEGFKERMKFLLLTFDEKLTEHQKRNLDRHYLGRLKYLVDNLDCCESLEKGDQLTKQLLKDE